MGESSAKETEETTSTCGWEHDYPSQEFEVGPRICQRCGHKEY